ncbi:hypothetical protein Tsubulata_001429, partial [Turnera subulata]
MVVPSPLGQVRRRRLQYFPPPTFSFAVVYTIYLEV